MMVAMALGGVLGWYARDSVLPPERIVVAAPDRSAVNQAFLMHAVYTPEVRHPVEVDAKEEKHLVAWLSKRLKAKVQAPYLGKLGYRLLGGRLVTSGEGPAAMFMYQDEQGKRLTLYVYRNAGKAEDTAFQYAQKNGVQAFYWVDSNLGYVLTGAVDRSVISRAARAVYDQLNG